MRGATGDYIGAIFETIGTVLTGLVIAFSSSWRVALCLLGVYPLLIIGSVFEFNSYERASGAQIP